MMSSDAARKKGLDSDSGDSTSVSSRPEDDRKQPHMRWSDTSSTTNEPASLRIMLDRESQKDNTTVKWSTDGNSFIITDHTQFEVGWYFQVC